MLRRFALAIAASAVIAAPALSQISWDKPHTPKPLANPAAVRVARDAARDVARAVVTDPAVAQKLLGSDPMSIKSESVDPSTGVVTITTAPVVFTRGIVADTQYKHFAEVTEREVRHIVRGRVALRVEVAPKDTSTATVGIYAVFEGLNEGATATEWITSPSRGIVEDRFLRRVVARANGDDSVLNGEEDGGADLPDGEGEDDTPTPTSKPQSAPNAPPTQSGAGAGQPDVHKPQR